MKLDSAQPKTKKLQKQPPKHRVTVKVLTSQIPHLEEFHETHGWSLNETVNRAIVLLLSIQAMDKEDRAEIAQQRKPVARESGRLQYEGRLGKPREIANELMTNLGRIAPPSSITPE